MKNLTYSLCYTPSTKQFNKELNFICTDDRIHIRLDNYNIPKLIFGFEKKLTYLLTYLFNYSYLPIISCYDSDLDNLFNKFLTTSDVVKIIQQIQEVYSDFKFKGLKVVKNYKKINYKMFGDLNIKCFPLDQDKCELASLDMFLNILKINLYDYLFNDSFTVIIHETKEEKHLNKFINKQNKKLNKIKETDLDLIKL